MNCIVFDCVTPVLSLPIGVKPVPALKLKVGNACEVGCWLILTPVRSSCESAICAFNRKAHAGDHIGKSKPKLIQQTCGVIT